MKYFLLSVIKAFAEIYYKIKYFLFKARHGFNPTPEDIEAYFREDLKNTGPMTPWDRNTIKMVDYVMFFGMMHEDNDFTFMWRAVVQNKLHVVDPSTIKLYERLCKYEGNPYSFLISHLYTRRWLPDHKFAWICHTEKWDELVKAALGYNK